MTKGGRHTGRHVFKAFQFLCVYFAKSQKYTLFCFCFCFCSLILRGDPLSQRLLSRGPTESLQHTHTHTYSYTLHNHQQSQTIKSYTHTLCGQWQHFFFQVIHYSHYSIYTYYYCNTVMTILLNK